MAQKYIYPQSITPHFTRRDEDREIQSLSTNPEAAWGNVCNNEPGVICWGDVNPDAVDSNDPVYSSNFYNTITTESGSFDTPTPFTTNGWNENPISKSAKIKKIDVEYVWDQVIYTTRNNCVTWRGSGCLGHYDSAGGYFRDAPRITLSIAGKNLTVTGPNVNSSSNCTYKNSYQYSESELKFCAANIPGVSGLRGSDLANAQITFAPGKNYASDVSRIVMLYIRLNVEYEDVPPAFVLDDASLSESVVTNCPDEKTTLTVKLKNNSETQGQTRVRISGDGIASAGVSNQQITGNDIFRKDNNDYVWEVKTDCYSRQISFDISYNKNVQARNYNIKVALETYRGKGVTAKDISISVKSCKPDFSFDILDSNGNVTKERQFIDIDENTNSHTVLNLRLKLNKNQILNHNETLQIDMGKGDDTLMSFDSWSTVTNPWRITTTPANHQIKVSETTSEEANYCTFSNIKDYTEITIEKTIILEESGIYNITARYKNTTDPSWNMSIPDKITVKGTFLGSDYFKLRLEDGSDVRYNSLMITEGDDLLEPITYTTEEIDKYVSQMKIYGENKRIPIGETQYVHFTINLETEKLVELKNVLTYIEIYDENFLSNGILVGAGKGVNLLEMDDEYICSIDSISSKEPTVVKLAVKSDVEIEDVVIKIKPYNYDGYNSTDNWVPSHIMFKDIPNIKISITGPSDIVYDETNPDDQNSYFWLNYHIQNLSETPAKNVRFQLVEPTQFKKIDYQLQENINAPDQLSTGVWFNHNNRIITFPILEANSADNILAVKYQAKKRGIYDFVIKTLDNEKTLEDDQYQNSYTHAVLVNIPNDVIIRTSVSNNLPYVDELIDFTIKIKNLYKAQKDFKFDIYDIGGYDNEHETNDYCIEYVKCKQGTFTPMHGDSYKYPDSHTKNKIGEWIIDEMDVNDEYILTLTMRPQDIGNHIIKTLFTDRFSNTKDFYNEVKVLERNKQLDFNVYHAVSDDENAKCDNCDNLIRICDDDFINLGDDIFYVFEIKNNSRNPISNALHVYARLPESFLTNKILCSSRSYFFNQKNNLISFTIPNLPGCLHEDSTVKFCIKIQPSQIGKFISHFSLSTRNSHVLHKQLTLTVDTEFNERKIEHEINIYNFEKTNKYYRYEIDNVGSLFKYFNTGDKTLRPIDIEKYQKSAVETYKGTNLRNIVSQIKEKSKYVDPLFLRVGNNKLADKGYELFPDGLIRRFGLLNSEVYHYTGQFPITTDLVDRAMKWDIDTWDTKLWAGGIYDNGVFGLTIDYAKIPSNFNILKADNPINNLQNLVDNVKPYGTKAICHYSATVRANLQMNIDTIATQIKYDIDMHIILSDDFTIVSAYNRYDNTIDMHYDLAKIKLHADVKRLNYKIKKQDKDINNIKTQVGKVSSHIYADKIDKMLTKDCYHLIAYSYNTNEQKKNIDITKPYKMTYNTTADDSLTNIQIINFKNNINNKEQIGFNVKTSKDIQIYTHDDNNGSIQGNIKCVFHRDDINDFTGFELIVDNQVIQERNINTNINDISLQIQTCLHKDKNILHFWGSVNKNNYYHIGLLILDDFKNPSFTIINENNRNISRYSVQNANDKNITFQISDKINNIIKKHSHIYAIEKDNKWDYLDNINKGKNKYAFFENNINVDRACKSHKINVPKLALKYSDFNIDDLDEITDIQFRIEAQSNKNNFADDININLFKNGDKYIPSNELAREIVYPSRVSNVNQDFITTFDLEQENMTICSKCLKTSLGYHDTCQYCGSQYVTHADNKTPATACYNCGWILNGWHEYCTHCLSYDIEKIQIDYNKTYCQSCGTLSLDYYQRCPQCFSSKVTHLTNNTTRYQIFGEDKKNIEPIIINMDADNQYIDVFSLYIGFNKYTQELSDLQYLTLKVHGTNYNDGKYYYCEACGSANVGNYDRCPYCKSKLIKNYSISNYVLRPFYHSGNSDMLYEDMLQLSKCKTNKQYNAHISSGQFTKEIDLLKCACHNDMDQFKLTFRIENQSYKEIQEAISKLPVRDDYKVDILDTILPYDISIDNLSLDYKYKNENEWSNLGALEGPNHTGISYRIPNSAKSTDRLHFSDFDIEKGKYKHAYLYIAGFLKNIEDMATMHIEVTNNKKTSTHSVDITSTLFNYEYNILDYPDMDINDLSVKVSFDNATPRGEVIITDCHIVVESAKYKNEIHDNINDISSEYIQQHNDYLFKSLNNDLWGLNNTAPYYLSGRQLKTNLIGYIDFGKLDLQEYIRIYNIDMIVSYKAKNGNIISEVIAPLADNNSFKSILRGAGYSTNEINNIINNNTYKIDNMTDIVAALKSKGIDIIDGQREQLLSGNIHSQHSALWGTINYTEDILNNLEYEVTNVNEDDELINDIPLHYQIAQAFNTGDNITSISKVYLNYFGKKGYPSNIIDVYLCKDYDGKPGSIIASNKVTIENNIKEVINVNLDAYNLNTNTKYWLVITDMSANNNNYHRFKYNNNPDNNPLVGECLTYNKHYTYQERVLSFQIGRIKRHKTFYKLPAKWIFNKEDDEGYKIHYILYRYNIQEGNNVSLSNFSIKNGYNIWS